MRSLRGHGMRFRSRRVRLCRPILPRCALVALIVLVAAAAVSTEPADDDSVLFQYKWKAKPDELHGPYTAAQMQQWKEQGFFQAGVLVQRVDKPGTFYDAGRFDFELYT